MNSADKNTFGYLVNDVTRLMRKHFDRRAQRFGLTRAQWRALKRVHHSEGMTQNDLAEFLEMEPIAVGRVIDRLQKAGFIERRADPSDRRCWRLHLLEKAHDVVDDMELISSDLFKQAQRGIGAGDMKIMLDVFMRMKQNLVELDVIKPDLVRPDSIKPDSIKPDSIKPDPGKRDTVTTTARKNPRAKKV